MILRFNQFIIEELNISDMDKKTILEIKRNLLFRLKEYKDYILSNIELIEDKPHYKNFDQIDIRVIIREVSNEFGNETVDFIQLWNFLEKINLILSEKKGDVKKMIRKEFYNYQRFIDEMVKN
jgi:hypothetical protein